MLDAEPIRVFIGYDHDEAVAYHVAAHSILRLSTRPVSIQPVALHHLTRSFRRARDQKQSNDFSFSRWLVPWMCNYEGVAIWMDCDVLLRADISQLWALFDPRYTVQVVQQVHYDSEDTKFLGRAQHNYARKNWSSVMVFNNKLCTALTPAYISTAPGLDLHQFRWVDYTSIGKLPADWNHLVGVHDHNPNCKLAHFTLGGPWFPKYAKCPFSDEWRLMFADMVHHA